MPAPCQAAVVQKQEMTGKTREEAAVWVCKEMEKRGEKPEEELLKKIEAAKRISDLSKVAGENQRAVLLAYHWGIIGGKSNGPYSKNRSFEGKEQLTKKEWNTIRRRVKYPEKRLKLSPDGQLCRTKNLPPNSKKFSYILDSYPNSYYQGTFDYERYEGKYKEGEHYVNPADLDKAVLTNWKTTYPMKEVRHRYGEAWKECIYQNLKARLNVDYRRISKDYKWLNQLRNTYYIYGDWQSDERQTMRIEEYIEKVKRNKLVIKGIVDIDSSSLYESITGYFMRAHIKFKVVSAKEMPRQQTDLIFGSHIYLKDVKKGVWKEAIVDIGLGSANAYSNGGDYAVVDDALLEPLKK